MTLQAGATFRYHLTKFVSPSSSAVLGRYPSIQVAFDVSAHVTGESPGCRGRQSQMALRPVTLSSSSISSVSFTGCELPRLKTSKGAPSEGSFIS